MHRGGIFSEAEAQKLSGPDPADRLGGWERQPAVTQHVEVETERQEDGHRQQVRHSQPGQNDIGRCDHLATRQHHDVDQVGQDTCIYTIDVINVFLRFYSDHVLTFLTFFIFSTFFI